MVNRQKKVIFYHQTSKKCRVILAKKAFQGIKISLFQLIFTDSWLLKNLLTGKNWGHVLKNNLSEHYKTLQLSYIVKYFEILYVKG